MDTEREPGADRKRKRMESMFPNHEEKPNHGEKPNGGLNLDLSLCPPSDDARPPIQSSQSPPPLPPPPPPPPPPSSSPSLSGGLHDCGPAAPQEPFTFVLPNVESQERPYYIPHSTGQQQQFNYAPIAPPWQQQDSLPPSAYFIHQGQFTPNEVAQQERPQGRRSVRTRRNHNHSPHGNKDEHVPPPFKWATNHRATVHRLDHLRLLAINKIQGEVQCKRCEARYEIEFDLNTEFEDISGYIKMNKASLKDRAPKEWMNPKLPDCNQCKQTDCMKPMISPKKRSINWLFLLLGKMLGCCTLEQLKYFCKHTKNHRTGAKDRVLYLTYLGLCKQLDPDGPFDRD